MSMNMETMLAGGTVVEAAFLNSQSRARSMDAPQLVNYMPALHESTTIENRSATLKTVWQESYKGLFVSHGPDVPKRSSGLALIQARGQKLKKKLQMSDSGEVFKPFEAQSEESSVEDDASMLQTGLQAITENIDPYQTQHVIDDLLRRDMVRSQEIARLKQENARLKFYVKDKVSTDPTAEVHTASLSAVEGGLPKKAALELHKPLLAADNSLPLDSMHHVRKLRKGSSHDSQKIFLRISDTSEQIQPVMTSHGWASAQAVADKRLSDEFCIMAPFYELALSNVAPILTTFHESRPTRSLRAICSVQKLSERKVTTHGTARKRSFQTPMVFLNRGNQRFVRLRQATPYRKPGKQVETFRTPLHTGNKVYTLEQRRGASTHACVMSISHVFFEEYLFKKELEEKETDTTDMATTLACVTMPILNHVEDTSPVALSPYITWDESDYAGCSDIASHIRGVLTSVRSFCSV